MKIIIYVEHDRHTDDKFKVFPYSEENWNKAVKMCEDRWEDGDEIHYYGDYCYGFTDEYCSYLVVQNMED